MTPALVALAIAAGTASILIGTGVLLACDTARAGVRTHAATGAGFAFIVVGAALVGTVLKALV